MTQHDTAMVCRQCGAPMAYGTPGSVYQDLIACVDFCNQFGPGMRQNPILRLRANLDHAESWAVASAMTPQHAESVRESFADVNAAFDAVVALCQAVA